MQKKNKTKKFSEIKYYKFIGLFLVFPIWLSLRAESFAPIVYFLLFGLFGMLGEILFSEWWKSFYEQPLYKYSVEGIVHSFSAKINFIPWGVAGLFCLWLINIFFKNFPGSKINLNTGANEFYYVFIVCFFAGFAFQFMVRAVMEFVHPRSFKFKKVGFLNQFLFLFPFLLGIAVSSLIFGKVIIWFGLGLGLFAALAEYGYGKVLEHSFGKKFWIYKPWSFDHGHFTPLAIIPFALMGFYFWAIYGVIVFLTKSTLYV